MKTEIEYDVKREIIRKIDFFFIFLCDLLDTFFSKENKRKKKNYKCSTFFCFNRLIYKVRDWKIELFFYFNGYSIDIHGEHFYFA